MRVAPTKVPVHDEDSVGSNLITGLTEKGIQFLVLEEAVFLAVPEGFFLVWVEEFHSIFEGLGIHASS